MCLFLEWYQFNDKQFLQIFFYILHRRDIPKKKRSEIPPHSATAKTNVENEVDTVTESIEENNVDKGKDKTPEKTRDKMLKKITQILSFEYLYQFHLYYRC